MNALEHIERLLAEAEAQAHKNNAGTAEALAKIADRWLALLNATTNQTTSHFHTTVTQP